MSGEPLMGSTVTTHLIEIVEWTPELAHKIAGIKVIDDLHPTVWSLPPEAAAKYPFKKRPACREED